MFAGEKSTCPAQLDPTAELARRGAEGQSDKVLVGETIRIEYNSRQIRCDPFPGMSVTTIVLPPAIEVPLAAEARKLGTTPERLALDCLRKEFAASPGLNKPVDGKSLHDFLNGYMGTVNGSSDALSEKCGERFAQGLAEKQQRGHL